MSHRIDTGSKDADPVPLIHGRFGFGVPKAKRNSIVLDEITAPLVTRTPPSNLPLLWSMK